MKQFIEFAAKVAEMHDGQYCKNGVTPFIVHPMRVAMSVGYTNEHPATYVALAHDIIEDCPNHQQFIDWMFGKWDVSTALKARIHQGVLELTKDEGIHPRAAKWADQIAKVMNSRHTYIREIKIYDRIDNLLDMEHDDFFWNIYLPESWDLYEAVEESDVAEWRVRELYDVIAGFDCIREGI